MSAHSQGSGPRSNAYSESKFTNWAVYDPFWMEAKAALKRFDWRILPILFPTRDVNISPPIR